MPIPKTARQKLLDQALKLLEEKRSILILLGLMNSRTREEVETEAADVEASTKADLQRAIKLIGKYVSQLREDFKATQPIGFYTDFLKPIVSRLRNDLSLTVPIFILDHLFEDYPEISEKLRNGRYPPHARLELDHKGSFAPRKSIEIHLLEAILFEDMCFYWNRATEISPKIGKPDHTLKKLIKEANALRRGAITEVDPVVRTIENWN